MLSGHFGIYAVCMLLVVFIDKNGLFWRADGCSVFIKDLEQDSLPEDIAGASKN